MPNSDPLYILGIDPGYDRLGYAVIKKTLGSKETVEISGTLSSKAADSFSLRLASLGAELERLFENFNFTVLGIENLFISNNKKTATRVAEVRGLILYLAGKHQVPVLELTPPEVKLAVTGFGAADKKQIISMIPLLVVLPAQKRHDDEYDAIAIALAAGSRLKFSQI